MASEEWCTVPWEIRSKVQWHRVFDIMAQLPGLLQIYDIIERDATGNAGDIDSRRLELFQNCGELDDALQTWHHKSGAVFGFKSADKLWYTLKDSRSNSPFAFELDFTDQIHAQAATFYWTACVILYSTMNQLHYALQSGSINKLPRPTDPADAAALIVQSISYIQQPSVGLLTRKIFAFPLVTAYAYFTSMSPKSPFTLSSNSDRYPYTSTFPDATPSAEWHRSRHILTYISDTATSMHIRGVKLDVLCSPAILHVDSP